MKRILIFLLLLLPFIGYGQSRVYFGGTRGTDTAYTPNNLRSEGVVVFPTYKQTSDSVLLGVDAMGKLYKIKISAVSGGGGGVTNLGLGDSTVSTRVITSSSGSDVTLPAANNNYAGLMTSTMKKKLDSLSVGGGAFYDSVVMATNYRVDTAKKSLRTDINGRVPNTRTLTINGVGYDLSANRSWTIATGDSSIYATLYRVDTAKNSLRNDINNRVKYTDTSGMLAPYFRKFDTSNLLATKKVVKKLRFTGTTTKTLTLTFADNDTLQASFIDETSGGGTGIKNLNGDTNSTQLFYSSGALVVSSDLSGHHTFTVDTNSVVATKYRLDTAKVNLRTDINSKVPSTRTLTINGTGYDLTANRSWTIPVVDSSTYATNYRVDTAKKNLRTDINGRVPNTRTLTINGTGYDLSANRTWTIPIPDSTVYFSKYRSDTMRNNIYNGNSFIKNQMAVSQSGNFSISGAGVANYLYANRVRSAYDMHAKGVYISTFDFADYIPVRGIQINNVRNGITHLYGFLRKRNDTVTSIIDMLIHFTIDSTTLNPTIAKAVPRQGTYMPVLEIGRFTGTGGGYALYTYDIDTGYFVSLNCNLYSTRDTTDIQYSSGYYGLKMDMTGVIPVSYIISGGGGGSGDSTTFATNYRVDTAKANIRNLINSIPAITDGDKGDITVSGSGTSWNVDKNAITNAKFRQSSALSVVGNSTNSTANVADIAAGSDYQVLRRNGTSIGFGAVNLAQTNAVTGSLNVANGGTGVATITGVMIGNGTSNVSAVTGTASQWLRRNSGNTAYEFFTPSASDIPSLSSLYLPLGGGTLTGAIETQAITPAITETYDIGEPSFQYNNVYAKMVYSNGTELKNVSLTAGTGISITGTYPSLTIAATGGGSASLTKDYIGFGDASNVLTGDSSLKYDGSGTITMNPISADPVITIKKNGTKKGAIRRIASSSSHLYTADNLGVEGNSGLDLFSGNDVNMSTYTGKLTFNTSLSQRITIENSGTIKLNGLATYGAAKYLTVGYGGEVGSTTIPTSSGTYSPTLSNVNNTSSLSLTKASYTKNGAFVDVWIEGSVTVGGSAPEWSCTLPIASTLSSGDLVGVGVVYSSSYGGNVHASKGSGNNATFKIMSDYVGTAIPNTTYTFKINFNYEIK